MYCVTDMLLDGRKPFPSNTSSIASRGYRNAGSANYSLIFAEWDCTKTHFRVWLVSAIQPLKGVTLYSNQYEGLCMF